jgi:hypothetical protein
MMFGATAATPYIAVACSPSAFGMSPWRLIGWFAINRQGGESLLIQSRLN